MQKDLDFLQELNKVQREAVVAYKGPGLVIAGAGSGKTRVLTYRIAYLLKQGVNPRTILPLTFTNKAAREMKERIASLVGPDNARSLWMGTFHSVFARILRYEAEKLGYPSDYTIYDTIDSRNLIRTIIKEKRLDDKTYKTNEVLGRISSAKNNLQTAKAYMANTQLVEQDRRNGKPELADIYRTYMARCYKAGAMDFDDLLLNTNILFRDFPGILEQYQHRFHYILVDEYQDTNFAQYMIIKKLADKHKNICVVGDDAQSIYSFRGAKIENILNFKHDYPGYQLFKLEQNYRSTKNIVNAANSIIDNNREQIKKTVWSDNESGEKIKVLNSLTDNEEGYVVANHITELRLSGDYEYKDFAILYRTNAQSRIFEEVLRRNNIPYKVYGSISFYQRKEIKDLLAYFRLVVNQKDDEAFKRIINYPARGIGRKTLEKIEEAANAHEVNLWDVIAEPVRYKLQVTTNAFGRVADFMNFIRELESKAATMDAYELGNEIASRSGMLRDLSQDKTPEAISKYENVQEMLNGMKEFTLNHLEENGKSARLVDYMENVSLLTDADNEKPEDFNKVTIMTIHSAKGLEFSNVFVTGLEEELFPSWMTMSTQQGLEEERRLFYVAVTRARKNAFLTFTQSRYRYGSPTMCNPSRFLREIDTDYLDISEEANHILNQEESFSDPVAGGKSAWNMSGSSGNGRPWQVQHGSGRAGKGDDGDSPYRNRNYGDSPYSNGNYGDSPYSNGNRNRRGGNSGISRPGSGNAGDGIAGSSRHTGGRSGDGKPGETPKGKLIRMNQAEKNQKNNSSNLHDSNNLRKFAADAPEKIKAGMIVEHPRFGKGKVLTIEGNAPNSKATVFFNNSGQKQLLLKFAKLRIIE